MHYEIFVNGTDSNRGTLLHDSATSDIDTKLETVILQLEDSKAGSLNFDIYPEHPSYNLIGRLTSYIDVYQDGEEIWSGRVLQEEIDFNRVRSLYCEGELAYLNDTCQPQMEYKNSDPKGVVKAILDVHNQRVDDRRKFYLKDNNASFPSLTIDPITFTTQYSKTLDSLQDLMSKYNWHVHIERAVVDGHKRRYLVFAEKSTYETNSSQVIKFGKNLTDYAGSFDLTEIATVLVPLGQKKSSAGQTLIGDKLEWTGYWENQYFDSEGYSHSVDGSASIPYDETARGYCIGEIEIPRTMWSTNEKRHYLYFTGRNDNGHAMYFFRDRALHILSMKTASNSVVATESLEEKIEVPVMDQTDPDETLKIYTSGYMSGLALRVNNQKDVDQVFDEYTTVESVNDGSVYVKAESINLFKPGITLGDIDHSTGSTISSTGRYMNVEPIALKAGTYTLSLMSNRSSHEIDIFFYIKDEAQGGALVYRPSESQYNKTLEYTFTIENDRYCNIVFKRRDLTDMQSDDILNIQLEMSNVAHPYESPLTPLDIYGWFERQVTWDDTTDPQVLKDRAITYLKSGQFDKMTITIKAFDLALMEVSAQAIKLGQSIRVTSKPHGLDRYFDVTKIEINISNWSQTMYTLGSTQDFTLTGSSNQINDTLTSIISGDGHNALIAEMRLQAVAQVLGANGGGVTTILSDDNRPIATMYSADPPSTPYLSKMSAADKRLRCIFINYEGMLFYDQGFGDWPENPNPPTITLVNGSGQIVANAIAAGTMLADRIRGGILELTDYQSGGQTLPATIKISGPDSDPNHTWHGNNLLTINRDVPFFLYDGATSWPGSKGRWLYMDDAIIIGGDDWLPPGQSEYVHSTAGAIWPNFSWGTYGFDSGNKATNYTDATGVVIGAVACVGISAPFILVRENQIAGDSGRDPLNHDHPDYDGWNVGLTNTNMPYVSGIEVDKTTISDGEGGTIQVVTDVRVTNSSHKFVNGLCCDGTRQYVPSQ